MHVHNVSAVQEKPFACDVKGCHMTFTNKDHLDWHQKKHEMMLNLGLVNKAASNEVADQTPTPTRFIRNCEEVGLFQDLHANPFDEIFRKAADLAKYGGALEIQESNSNDSLHTPNILPHIAENLQQHCNTHSKNYGNYKNFIFFNTSENESDSEDSIIVIETEAQTDVRKKIKQTINNRVKKNENNKIPLSSFLPFEFIALDENSTKENNVKPTNRQSVNSKVENRIITEDNNVKPTNRKNVNNKIEKVREMNRAAQFRCRRKKQQKFKEMEDEIAFLIQENVKLKQQLDAVMIHHSKCMIPGPSVISTTAPESSQSVSFKKITSSTALPLFIQVIPNTQISLISPKTEKKT